MKNIIDKVENHVVSLLSNNLDQAFVYHNISHTQRVVEKTLELANISKLNEKEILLLTIAAWFHDTGYTVTVEGHESESAKFASKFLKENNFTEADINRISELIKATKADAKPEDELEKIIKDADCAHVSSKNYNDFAILLRNEWESLAQKKYADADWLQINVDFVTDHRYFSRAANKHWSDRKYKNLSDLLQAQQKLKQNSDKFKQKSKELKYRKNKKNSPERGIETMFRVALKNHITLSDIADTKANILLSVNAIIISVALSNLLPKLDNPSNAYLIYPTLIFLAFTVICIVLSVLATRPNVTKGKFTKEDVARKKVNILFFGNFHQMKFKDFDWAMQEVMEDKRYLYGSLTKDLYYLGLVLNRKYNLLRITYTVFMIGIVISVFSFGVSFLMSDAMQN